MVKITDPEQRELWRKALKYLRQWANKDYTNIDNLGLGICDNIRYLLPVDQKWYNTFRDLCREWPEFSGKGDYPIPVPEGWVVESPESCYKAARSCQAQWTNTEYGELRRNLCLYIVNNVEL